MFFQSKQVLEMIGAFQSQRGILGVQFPTAAWLREAWLCGLEPVHQAVVHTLDQVVLFKVTLFAPAFWLY
jgi:hypothetical protein